MPFPTILEKYGSLSATGFAKETTFGTPVAATTFLPMVSNTMEEDPGWFAPHLMQGLRDLQVYNLYGEAKFNGTINGPIFPANAINTLSAAIGADNLTGGGIWGTIVTPTSTTLNGSTTAGATSVTVTSGSGFAAGQELILDTGGIQEVRRITNVATNVLTLQDALVYAHQTGVTAVTGVTTTLSAPSIATATTVTVTSATGIVAGTIIQIDVNSVAGGLTSEVRKVTLVSTNTLTLDQALVYAHASAAVVTIVQAPFTHTIQEQNTLPSLTVEKNAGNFQSLQFAGCRVNKYEVKAPTGNSPVDVTMELMGQSVAVLNSPTAISVSTDVPFVFAEANLLFYNTLRTDVHNVTVSIENGVKETYTYSNFHGPSFLTPVTLHVMGSVDVVWSSFNDTTYGDFNRLINGTLGTLIFTLVHPSSGGTITFTMPQVVVAKFAQDIKMEDVILANLTYEASRPLSGLQQYTIQASVANAVYLPY